MTKRTLILEAWSALFNAERQYTFSGTITKPQLADMQKAIKALEDELAKEAAE